LPWVGVREGEPDTESETTFRPTGRSEDGTLTQKIVKTIFQIISPGWTLFLW